ncbi:hypothetical protein WA026_011192 [Henosepilachna vigintioctopunctata]|uniref:Helix-turn-helix domain-containing protein n=1 Tax=Henosepilachna vigintioctopunctata TaxID=420089 RepID=A0AAW1U621_9CUCU
MGSPISSITAQIVMEYVEEQILTNRKFKITLYKRYVDDCLLIIDPNDVDVILNDFNNFHPKLQFTLESENNGSINFLYMTIIRDKDKLYTKWYTKNTSTNRLINFHSAHHISQKRSIVDSIINRAIKLTSPKYRPESLDKAKSLLTLNNYPRVGYIGRTTKCRELTHQIQRIEKHIYRCHTLHT